MRPANLDLTRSYAKGPVNDNNYIIVPLYRQAHRVDLSMRPSSRGPGGGGFPLLITPTSYPEWLKSSPEVHWCEVRGIQCD